MLKSAIAIVHFALLFCVLTLECPTPCSSCSSDYTCTACTPGNMLAASKCVPCTQHCSACDSRGLCTACSVGIIQGGLCLSCSGNCANLTACSQLATNCTSCLAPLILSGSSRCGLDTNCPVWNCISCVVSTSNSSDKVCQNCLPNHFAFDNFCHLCPFPCSSCSLPLSSIFDSQVAEFMDDQLVKAYNSSAASQNYANLTYWQKQNLFTLLVLFRIVNTSASHQQQFNDLLKQYGILIGPNNIAALKLNISQKTSILAILYPTISDRTATFTLLNRVRSSYVSCSACNIGFYNSSGRCSPCSSGCLACTSGSICLDCSLGYALVNSTCQKCIYPCLTCQNSPTNCSSCTRSHYLSVVNNCQVCQASSCQTCSMDGTKCINCVRPFSRLPHNGVCYRCTQDLCYHCSAANISQCLECVEGLILALNGTCMWCPPKCSVCIEKMGVFVCRKCLPGLTLQNGVCTSCGSGCSVCSASNAQICQKCTEGLFLNPWSVCQSCGRGCQQCTDYDGICTQLSKGYVVRNNSTSKCAANRCQICSSQNPAVCLQCRQGNYLSQGTCFKCGIYCEQCSSTGCTLCASNTILMAGVCKACRGNCLTCLPNNLASCITCKRGFMLNTGTNLCSSACTRGCIQCLTLNNTCLKCDIGYGLKHDGSCVRCLEGCSGACDPKNVSVCLSCTLGFQMMDSSCRKCELGCVECLEGVCTACMEGYSLSQQGSSYHCKQNCYFPCFQCDSTGCTVCESGYVYNGTDCVFDFASACIPECENCPAGSHFDTNTSRCRRCGGRGCSTCPQDVCTACFDGFYFMFSGCTPCPSSCGTCLDNTNCTSCAAGYIKQLISVDDDPNNAVLSPDCVPCNPNCKTCVFSSKHCETCADGYRLKDFQCFGRYRVGFSFKLNADYNQFLEQAYIQIIINNMAQRLGIEHSTIIIHSLLPGSTIVNGSISAHNQTEAKDLANQLYDAIEVDSSLLGFAASQIHIGVYYDETRIYDAATYRGVPALIIGCGIAVGILIFSLFLIVRIIQKKKPAGNRQRQANAKLQKLWSNYEKQNDRYSIHELKSYY